LTVQDALIGVMAAVLYTTVAIMYRARVHRKERLALAARVALVNKQQAGLDDTVARLQAWATTAEGAVSAAREGERAAVDAVAPGLARIREAHRLFFTGAGVRPTQTTIEIGARATVVVELQNCGVLNGRVGRMSITKVTTESRKFSITDPMAIGAKNAHDGSALFNLHDLQSFEFNPVAFHGEPPPPHSRVLLESVSLTFREHGGDGDRTIVLGDVWAIVKP
jgi:hypothetical protein